MVAKQTLYWCTSLQDVSDTLCCFKYLSICKNDVYEVHKIGDKHLPNWNFRPTGFEVQCATDYILLAGIIYLPYTISTSRAKWSIGMFAYYA